MLLLVDSAELSSRRAETESPRATSATPTVLSFRLKKSMVGRCVFQPSGGGGAPLNFLLPLEGIRLMTKYVFEECVIPPLFWRRRNYKKKKTSVLERSFWLLTCLTQSRQMGWGLDLPPL